MTDGLGALEKGDLRKVIGPAPIRATLGSQLELLSAHRESLLDCIR